MSTLKRCPKCDRLGIYTTWSFLHSRGIDVCSYCNYENRYDDRRKNVIDVSSERRKKENK